VIKEVFMLKVRIKKLGTLAILCLQGRIVVGETAALRNAVTSLTNVTVVVLDLTRISMIDAAGFGLMLKLREELKARGIEIRLMNPTDRVSRLFEITRLNTVFEIASPSTVPSFRRAVGVSDLVACA
jgi:anti-anti-sigma factor